MTLKGGVVASVHTPFRKCGISVAGDVSEDFDIHIEGLVDYEIYWIILISIPT